MVVLVPIAFAAGVITVLTPCVLPVLPVVLAGGATGSKRRPYAIAAGLVTTFTLFVLAGAWVWSLIGIDARYQDKIGAALLAVLALTLVVPAVAELLERPLAFMTRWRPPELGGGVLLGAALGLVFVPCGGPVLAAVTSIAGRHRVDAATAAVATAYAIGAAVPLLLIARGSGRVTGAFRTHAQAIRVAAGVAMGAAALVVYQGWATSFQTKVPPGLGWLQRAIEDNGAAQRQLAQLKGEQARSRFAVDVPLHDFGPAPGFRNVSAWLNTPALGLSALRGKVVLVDFWTYSCINCLRTLPYLEQWDERYRSKGLVVVGVHTPEFAFEHDLGNVRAAVRRLGVRYPVALDNDYGTWNAYSNQYWPAEYLIDQNGHVRHAHFGEGAYSETERLIRLLVRAGGASSLPRSGRDIDRTPTGLRTPETYLGYDRLDRFDSNRLVPQQPYSYRLPRTLPVDHWAYGGTWRIGAEQAVAATDARLRLRFHARRVHLVAGGKGFVTVIVDGKPRPTVRVDGSRLYTVVSLTRARDATLELAFTGGLAAYSFTFG
jgi:cytochrome c biogenesis protein CcdA/thiol-disulfide isomerase/thioredoxin